MQLENAFKTSLHKFISPGESVVIGLSGGPDSVCLLHLLNGVKDEMGLKLYAAHFNHMLRGRESERDELFCEKLALSLGIPFMSAAQDIKKAAKESGCGTEKAARDARYSFFLRCCREAGAKKIALAHNLDDNAETVLMRLIQGAGSEGLSGIPPVRRISGGEFGMPKTAGAMVVRPLSAIQKRDILAYLKRKGLAFVTDRTNRESVYLRNRIRNILIPAIERQFNPSFKSALAAVSSIASQENAYLSKIALKANKKVVFNKGIKVKPYLRLPQAIRYRVMKGYLAGALSAGRRLTYEVISGADNAVAAMGTCNLPNNMVLRCASGFVHAVKLAKTRATGDESVTIHQNTAGGIVWNGYRFSFSRAKAGPGLDLKKRNTACLDLAKVKYPLCLRMKRAGDRFVPFGMTGAVRLKKFLSGSGAPAIVLADREKILWAGLCRVDDRARVSQMTKNVLIVTASRAG